MPGEVCEADCQCQMFYLDEQARSAHTNANLRDICDTVLCQSDSKPGGVFRVGPALEGTKCGEGRWCNDGRCVTAQFHQGGGGSHTSSAGSTGKKGPYFGPWSIARAEDPIARAGGAESNINLVSGRIPASVKQYLSLNEDMQREGGLPIVSDAEIKKAEEQEEIDVSDYIEVTLS